MADQPHPRTAPVDLTEVIQDQTGESYQLPCSLVQWTCWYLDRMTPGSAAYNVAVRFLLRGNLQVPLLEQALRIVIRRHEILRTRFIEHNGGPRQLVEPNVEFSLPL
jgi:hypothetical protein